MKRFWKWLISLWEKKKPKPEPKPEPKPDPDVFDNGTTASYTIRLKTYKPPYHKDRRFSCKLDKRYSTEQGLTPDNSKVTVNEEYLTFYGVDQENGRYDLAYCDKIRLPDSLKKPITLKVYKSLQLVTVIKMPEWVYGAVTVSQTTEL